MLNRFILRVGLICAAAQVLFGYAARQLPAPWSAHPDFIAHKVVALAVLLYMSGVGLSKWCRTATPSTAEERILGTDATGRLLAEVTVGMLLFWDIPSTVLVKELGNPVMFVHHIVMAAIAYVATSVGRQMLGYYAIYAFGVSEVSSVPLVFVDLLHPKYEIGKLAEESTFWSTVNGVARVTFVVLFLLNRALYCQYVALTGILPDVQSLLADPACNTKTLLRSVWVCAVFMLLLQMYWASLVLKQAVNAIVGKEDDALASILFAVLLLLIGLAKALKGNGRGARSEKLLAQERANIELARP
jgi:hypothetical protein